MIAVQLAGSTVDDGVVDVDWRSLTHIDRSHSHHFRTLNNNAPTTLLNTLHTYIIIYWISSLKYIY